MYFWQNMMDIVRFVSWRVAYVPPRLVFGRAWDAELSGVVGTLGNMMLIWRTRTVFQLVCWSIAHQTSGWVVPPFLACVVLYMVLRWSHTSVSRAPCTFVRLDRMHRQTAISTRVSLWSQRILHRVQDTLVSYVVGITIVSQKKIPALECTHQNENSSTCRIILTKQKN
jgi:hypothetical protein